MEEKTMNGMKQTPSRDIALTRRIQSRIKWDRRISNSDVHVLSKSGQVILIGKVDSPLKKEAASEIVKATKGVTTVVNQLEVPTTFSREDAELRSLIDNRINEISFIGKEHISVEVTRGCVKLNGTVLSKQKKALAAGIVWELSGVNDCYNLIKIDGEVERFERTIIPSTQPKELVLETNTHESLTPVTLAL